MYRRRHRPGRDISFSFDSFLDLVANVVGIILRLILVAWVGARAYTGVVKTSSPSPATKPSPVLTEESPPLAELAALEQTRRDIAQAQQELLAHLRRQEAARQSSQQDQQLLASVANEGQRLQRELDTLEECRKQVEAEAARIEIHLPQLRQRAQALTKQMQELSQSPIVRKELRYQTPVSEVVQSEELQFECRARRVSFLDVEAFLREIRRAMKDQEQELRVRWEITNRTAPQGAFRLRYVIARERDLLDSVAETKSPDRDSSFSYGLVAWYAEPIARERGESAAEALRAGSEFRKIVDHLDPRQTAVTFWVYPDSFALYRQLRDYLVARDILVAGRPLEEGMEIGASRKGTASRGQ